MEFKYRAVDGRPPVYFSPPSSSIGYFSEHALRGNYQITAPISDPELIQNEMINREIEKERIRAEIIAAEEMMMRRRILEAEVRRELMIERAMAMREVRGTLSFEERLMQLEPSRPSPLPPFIRNQFDNCCWLGDRSLFPAGRDLFDQRPEAWFRPCAKTASEDSKSKLIVLAKPDPNLCRVKRKAVTPPAGGAELFIGLKKPKEEWSCALCRVSATSEQGLNEHLQGKKHKAKEARLRANNMAKNPCSEPLAKKTQNQTEPAIGTTNLEIEPEVKEKLVRVDSNNDDTNKKKRNKAKDKLRVQKNKRAKKKLKKNVKENKERTAECKKKKFKFWCETCRVGAYSAVVMEAHEKGKKHLAHLQEFSQHAEDVLTVITVAESSEAVENVEAAAKKANEKMTENAINN